MTLVSEDWLNNPISYDLDDATKPDIRSYLRIKSGMLISFFDDAGQSPAEGPSAGQLGIHLTLSLMDNVT